MVSDMIFSVLTNELNLIGAKHGVGIIDVVEDRTVGLKSREVYEAPAAMIIIEAHKDLEKYFNGPTAAAISSDPISSAKILTKFSKSNNKLKIIAGFMDGKVLDEKEVSVIATLPSLEEARAKIVGILATPAQKLVSILLAPGSKIANLARAKSLKN